MISLALTLLLAAAPADDKGPLGVHLTTSVVAERIPLTALRGPIEMVVDPLGARIELRLAKPQPALVAQVQKHAGEICGKVAVTAAGIELHCRTRRFEATLNTDGAKKFLDIQELRGLPWRAGPGGPPSYHYEPSKVGLGAPCPGSGVVARGECALLLGKQLEAATQFRAGMESYDRQMAALRLGDMALGTGDPSTAIGWYRRAGVAGSFGRIARTRVCEIEGTCLATTDLVRRVYDGKGLPDPLRAEMTVRAVRVEAFEGRFESATRIMWQQIRNGSLAWMCREGGEIVCRRVLLQAMREAVMEKPAAAKPSPQEEPDAEPTKPERPEPTASPSTQTQTPTTLTPTTAKADAGATKVATETPAADAGAKAATGDTAAIAAVKAPAHADRAATPAEAKDAAPIELTPAETIFEVYLALPRWDHGPLAPELSEAAADLARHMGAPVFGGNILSAVAPEVDAADLPPHLYRAAELYFEGDDLARARLVIEYARTRIDKKMPPRWGALQRKIEARAGAEDEAANESPPKWTIDPEAIERELAAARAASARARVARVETAPKKQGEKP